MFTDNTRDEVTLIFLKYMYIELDWRRAIWNTFAEVRERNAQNLQAGTYEAIGKLCDEFFKTIAAESAQVG